MKRQLKYILLLVACLLMIDNSAYAAKKKTQKRPIKIEVVSYDGELLHKSKVTSAKNRKEYFTDAKGQICDEFALGDVFRISLPGYKTTMVELTSFPDSNNIRVTLSKMEIHEDENHVIYTVDGGKISDLRNIGAYSEVKGEDLERYPSSFLLDGLSGRLNGFFYRRDSNEPGSPVWSGFVRSKNYGDPIIMVDGVVRKADYIDPEAIETVQLLKDASLKSLYGGTASNGIIMITTKRGKAYENGVSVSVQSGVEFPSALPQYLNAREYTSSYNGALINSELPIKYNPENYNGEKLIEYPDVDYYRMFLRDHMNLTRANAQFRGGSKNTQYFLNVGFLSEKGLEKCTDNPITDNVLTVRGNIDNTLFDFLTLKVDINAALQNRRWPNTNASTYFSAFSDLRPNAFPVLIPGSLINSEEEYVLGGTSVHQNNPYGLLARNGYVHREHSFIQSNFSMLVDLDRWVKGLSITPSITFDVFNYYSTRKDGGFSVTEPLVFNENGEITSYSVWGHDNVVTSQVEGDNTGNRSWHFRTTANYDRTFSNVHKFSGLLMYFMQEQSYSGSIQSARRINIAARANYMYDNRYIVDASVNYIGVPSFSKYRRFGAFPTIGAGWVISNENFLKSSSFLDYMKIRASYGLLGSTIYDGRGIVSNYYYRDNYNIGGTYGQFNSFNNIVNIGNIGNPDLEFQKRHEINLGVDFDLFKRSIKGSIGFFSNYMVGEIVNSNDITPGILGKGSGLIFTNVKESSCSGVEAEITFSKRYGNFEFAVGGNITYSKSKINKELDINYPEHLSGLKKILNTGDVYGYDIIGTFADEQDIASSPIQAFSGKLYPGDFKYADTNNDGYVNEADRRIIANTTPKLQYGITLDLQYKGINLSVLGYGLGLYDQLLTNKYYQIYGSRKYSNVLNTGLPNGNPHPTLYAENNTNNFVNSDYWVAKGGFFKIRNVELGYTLPDKITAKARLSKVKFYCRASNLFTLSSINDLDPESLSAGLTQYPLVMTLTGGISFKF